MTTTSSTLAAALLDAQRNVRPVAKGGVNTAQGWRFIEAHDVVGAARDALHSAGLVAVLRHAPGERVDAPVLDVYLHVLHPASGQEMKLPMPWPIERSGPQARRAAGTYAEKEALRHLLLIPEPDDPETDAQQPTSSSGTTRPDAPRSGGPSDKQVRYLHVLLGQHGYSSRDSILAYLSAELGRDIGSSADLTGQETSDIITKLKDTPKADRVTAQDAPAADDPWSVLDAELDADQ